MQLCFGFATANYYVEHGGDDDRGKRKKYGNCYDHIEFLPPAAAMVEPLAGIPVCFSDFILS